MTRTQLHSFHVRRYTPPRMVVAVAGNVDHAHTVDWCAAPSPVTWTTRPLPRPAATDGSNCAPRRR